MPVDEAVGKLRAAIAVRNDLDPDVVILARTDSRAAVGGGVDEVLRRCEAYLAAGVDMLMITALQSREEIRTVREAFPEAPLKLNISIDPPLTQSEFRDFRVSIFDISISKIAQMMMFDFLTRLRRDGIGAFNDFTQAHKAHPIGMFGFLELTGFPKLLEIERMFLGLRGTLPQIPNDSIGLYDPRGQAHAGSGSA